VEQEWFCVRHGLFAPCQVGSAEKETRELSTIMHSPPYGHRTCADFDTYQNLTWAIQCRRRKNPPTLSINHEPWSSLRYQRTATYPLPREGQRGGKHGTHGTAENSNDKFRRQNPPGPVFFLFLFPPVFFFVFSFFFCSFLSA
jgi:hypothetical protein